MAHGNQLAYRLFILWTLISIPLALAQRSTFSNSDSLRLPLNTTTIPPPPVANPNDISNGTANSMPVCTALQTDCAYTINTSGGEFIQHTCCDMGQTCIPYGTNAGLCIPSTFSPASCPKKSTCVPTSALDGEKNALLLGPQCCNSDEFCSEVGCIKQWYTCTISDICIPTVMPPHMRTSSYPLAAECCTAGQTCGPIGCQGGTGQGGSNSTGTGSGSCSGSFTCRAEKICVPSILPDGSSSGTLLPAQCCTDGQFCAASGCQSSASSGRRFKRGSARVRLRC